MRLLFINSVCYGSTGRICTDLYQLAEKNGFECCIAFGRGNCPTQFKSIKIGTSLDIYSHLVNARLNDKTGLGSVRATKKFIKDIEMFAPDIIHLHNLHGYYINYRILFEYLAKTSIKVLWTLHDCWAFTGHCAYYLYAQCDKWKNECSNCILTNEYPKSFVDKSYRNYNLKKKSFLMLQQQLKLISVSNWLATQVNKSFLKSVNISIIKNGIDTRLFHYTVSDLKETYDLINKKIILGVASTWDSRKGLDDFIRLSKHLTDDFRIVLIGVSKKQQKNLPNNIIGFEKTNCIEDLVKWYSIADVFFNPTKEETFGLTNYEAQACGTTTVSYNAGGTMETLINENSYLIENLEEFISFLEKYDFDKKKFDVDLNKFDINYSLLNYIDEYKKSVGG